ncbi:MAG: undecaprenyldiphospho-muramoylpentapeptide beta-N-acetylglucosaminyltransferase [Clostridiales bacterium]|jgi:UDP-N-acetylglucosamine--N-acetylmuramyl-(pentapeptide) pyrophosphoryl-undecaprenol N-acetylglucosamine transferase|nr:undecaprenyldiphospho-muramoylpentapeptide beta-N-acetylglucosaminyltransferase [Clostridiales bacterium]
MKRIILTGGGTAGHVTPNLAIAPLLRDSGYELFYIGSKKGIEKTLAEKAEIPYTGISCGKLRRYFNLKNVTDIFRVVKGLGGAFAVITRLRPGLVFSKGGFVAVPVVIAAKTLGVKVIIHESDMTPGLANRLSLPFADRVCVCFPETINHVPSGKGILTGTPIRSELYQGSVAEARKICGFHDSKPVLLVMGGSQGSVAINDCLRSILPRLIKSFNVIHLCGVNNRREDLAVRGYLQFEYVSRELPHLLAYAEIIVSRAGANSISEFLALRKPNLLIPLPLTASRGDQILNAKSYEERGFSLVLNEDDMNAETLMAKINELYANRRKYTRKMAESPIADGTKDVLKVIEEVYGGDKKHK